MRYKKTRRTGFVYAELVAVAALVSSVSIAAFQVIRKGHETNCLNNLKQIHYALVMFETDNGALPSAAFFPTSARDPKNLANLLSPYLGNKKVFLCPSIPDELNKFGTNYLWNDTASGKSLSSVPGSTWLLTEMTAVKKTIPPPHGTRYGILYADSRAEVGPGVDFPEVSRDF